MIIINNKNKRLSHTQYLPGPILRASHLFSYLISNHNFQGGEDALVFYREGKETLRRKVTWAMRLVKSKAGTCSPARLTLGPYSELQAICPTVCRLHWVLPPEAHGDSGR